MKPQYHPKRHHRRSIRLPEYDYRQAGAYFVTICIQDREFLFGDVVDGEIQLNDAGRMVQAVWNQLPHQYPGVDVDAFIVMPNHVHGVIVLVDDPLAQGRTEQTPGQAGQAQGPAPTIDRHGPVGAPPVGALLMTTRDLIRQRGYRCPTSCTGSTHTPQPNTGTASNSADGLPFPAGSGNATTTNTSCAMIAP